MRVLLFHPRRKVVMSHVPHAGLAYLSASLKSANHSPVVADYMLLDRTRGDATPPPEALIHEYQPDVVGVTMYTAAISECDRIINAANSHGVPVIVGGPHASINGRDLAQDSRIHAVVQGEGEGIVNEVVEKVATGQRVGLVMRDEPPELDAVLWPDFSCFLDYEEITDYPWVTSRGCPYGCTFCAVRLVSSRRWRGREVADCLRELSEARALLPKLQRVEILDDCPGVRKERFKELLSGYPRVCPNTPLKIANTRADHLDEEVIRLAKAAGCSYLCLGVEHGDPEIFASLHKGETLQQIELAASLIRREGLELHLCFIIGLPGDSLAKTNASIRLAKRLRADLIYWNVVHPFKGTAIHSWFEDHGTVYVDDDYASYSTHDFRCPDPVADTPDFTRAQRKRAYLRAILATRQCFISVRDLPELWHEAKKYHELPLALTFSAWRVGHALKMRFKEMLCRSLCTRRLFAATGARRHNEVRRKRSGGLTHLKDMLFANPAEPMLAFWRAVELAALDAVEWRDPILDVGCGDGSVTESVLGRKRVLLGIDFDLGVLTRASLRGTYVATVCASALHLPVADESFATVFANCVLEHIADDTQAIREMGRVLRKGGRLILTVPGDLMPLRLWGVKFWLRRNIPQRANDYRAAFDKRFVHYHYRSVEEWSHILDANGLQLVVVRRYLPPLAQSFWERGQMFLEQAQCGRMVHRALQSPKLLRLAPLRVRVPMLWLLLAPLVLIAVRHAERGSCLLLVARKDY